MKLVIGNKNYSSWSLRPWILMRRAGLEFEELRIPLSTAEGERMKRELCPAGKVPVLYDGPLTLWDSLAICEYIADKVQEPGFWPRETSLRAEARAMSAEMHSGFAALRQAMPMNCRREVRGFEPDFDTRTDIDRLVDLFESALSRSGARSASRRGSGAESRGGEARNGGKGDGGSGFESNDGPSDGPWLFGAYSVADAMFAPIASRFRTYGIKVPPDTRAWIERTLQDPPMREWYAAAAAETETIESSEVPDRS